MPEIKSHGCYFRQDNRNKNQWYFGNNRICIKFSISSDKGLELLSLKNPDSQYAWACQAQALCWLAPSREGILTLQPTATEREGGGLTLEIRAIDSTLGYQQSFWFEAFPRRSVIRTWKTVKLHKNSNPCEIREFPSLELAFNSPADLSVQWIQGIRGYSAFAQKGIHPAFKVQKRTLSSLDKDGLDIYSGLRSSEENFGWIVIENDPAQESFFTGIEWSGEWLSRIQPYLDSYKLTISLHSFRHLLEKKEVIEFPKVFLGVVEGDADFASLESQQFLEHNLFPPAPKGMPWVMDNTWFSYSINQNEITMKAEIDCASQIRCDGFNLDAGWYAGSPDPGHPNDQGFSRGLGSWTPHPEKYPSGMRKLSDYVHAKGLKFGLWVEPERVSENTKDSSPQGWTEKMVAINGNHTIQQNLEENTKAYFLCLGCPETREWIKTWLSNLIRTNRLDWIKWDNNYWGVCTREDHGHQAGDGSYAHIRGLYEILDYIRQEFPNLVIEDCASGGNRIDFGILQRCHTAWLHDDSFNHHVVRQHLSGAAYMLPFRYRNSWVNENGDYTKTNPMTDDALTTIMRSRMLGSMGVSLRLADLSPDQKTELRSHIEFYKKYKDWFAYPLFHLTPQPDISIPDYALPAEWEVYQFFNRSEGKGVLLSFRNNHPDDFARVHLKNMKPQGVYELKSFETGELFLVSGDELMDEGFTLSLSQTGQSGLYFIKEK